MPDTCTVAIFPENLTEQGLPGFYQHVVSINSATCPALVMQAHTHLPNLASISSFAFELSVQSTTFGDET